LPLGLGSLVLSALFTADKVKMQGTWKRSRMKKAKGQERKQAKRKCGNTRVISERMNGKKERTREGAQ
jgi:hypothetical protein